MCLIFRVPGLTNAGDHCETPVSLVQLLPTLAELCGITMPSGIDGTSFVGNLREPHRRQDATVFAEHGLTTPHPGYMIREGGYKYCYYVDDMPELYNLRTDPKEMKNLALLPGYKDRVEQMKEKIYAWHLPAQAGNR
jgi:choline-sulfatase